jgi:hypothetical protein
MALANNLRNEKTKLLAAYVNSIAVSVFFVGVIFPFARYLFEGGRAIDTALVIWWFVGSLGTHWCASWMLSDLQEE